MYEFLNNNALGKYENDCVIRALSTATGRSWDNTYEHLSDLAQCEGTMMDDKKFVQKYLDRRYKRIYKLPKFVGDVAEMYDDNIVLITMSGHITCSKYGTIYDSFDPRSRIAESAWIVE